MNVWKRARMRRVARRELPNTDNPHHAHVVGEALSVLFSRGYSVERVLSVYPVEHRPEALEMMRVAATVYCPDMVSAIESVIRARVPDDISSL